MIATSLVDGMPLFWASVPPWLLWLGACVGHTFFLVTSLNVLYAWPLPHGVLRVTRKVDILIILAGPALFLWSLNFVGNQGPKWEAGSHVYLIVPYLVFSFFLGVVVVPLAMLRYWLRRPPAELLHNQGVVVDVARVLGYKPLGRGKDRLFARIPGNQVFQVEFTDVTLQLPRLPQALDGLTILHLTDLHFCGTPDREFYEFVMDGCCQKWLPDLVAITGDIVDSDVHHRWIMPIFGRLRWKQAAFAILGNHDIWYKHADIRRRLQRLGIHVLGNSWEEIAVKGEKLVVIGHEGPWFKPLPDLSTCPSQGFRLCLSHTPDNIAWGQRHNIDLMLAGHVHGGQIRLPVIGSLFVPSRYSRRYDCGTFFEPPTMLYVGRGLAGQHPLRFNCRPQVTRLTLRCPSSRV